MPTFDIVDMPIPEKLKLMETLWESLSEQSGGNIDSPDWHGEVLEERLRRLASGEDTVTRWKEAKERIRAQIKSH